MIKIKFIDSLSGSKSESKDILGDLDNSNS